MTLTRRLLHKHHHELWGIFKGDLQVGAISSGIGLNGGMIWTWRCGFHPGCSPSQMTEGTQPSYDNAKAEFEKAWGRLEPQITAEMADEWLKQQAWTAWKYAMRDAGLPLPTATTTGRSKCFCGAEIMDDGLSEHIAAKHTGTKNPYRA